VRPKGRKFAHLRLDKCRSITKSNISGRIVAVTAVVSWYLSWYEIGEIQTPFGLGLEPCGLQSWSWYWSEEIGIGGITQLCY